VKGIRRFEEKMLVTVGVRIQNHIRVLVGRKIHAVMARKREIRRLRSVSKF